jgi:hypothetical protein
MAFKMKGAPMHKGTAKHASALKSYASSPMKKTYKEAYAGLSEERKAKQSEADFTTEAKAYNTKKYDTTEPTKRAKSRGMDKKELAKDVKAVRAYDAQGKADNAAADKLAKENKDKPVVSTNQKSKRKVSVKEAKGRGTTAVKNSRKVFGRGSDEVKAAKKARKTSVKTAKAEKRATRKEMKTERLEKKMKAKEASSSGPRSASAGVAKRLAKRIANRKAKA